MSKTVEILLIEDSRGDVRLTREAFKEGKMPKHINAVEDGEEALHYLRRQGEHKQAARPDLILLDLHLPKKAGREVLAELKADPDLKRIPVVILTTSESEQDILKSYDLHANCYVTKPLNLDRFIAVVKAIEDFWLTTAKLPPG